jgi:hypothetical protein
MLHLIFDACFVVIKDNSEQNVEEKVQAYDQENKEEQA